MDTSSQDGGKQAFYFLTEIHEVIKCFESANQSKLTTRINELKAKFEKARSILATIPGIDMSQKEQEEYYLKLLKQYEQENELLQSYKDMCKFDIASLDNPSPTEKVEPMDHKSEATRETQGAGV